MLVDMKQICKDLNVSRTTVFKLMREGMPKHHLSPRMLRFDRDEVIKWVKRRSA